MNCSKSFPMQIVGRASRIQSFHVVVQQRTSNKCMEMKKNLSVQKSLLLLIERADL